MCVTTDTECLLISAECVLCTLVNAVCVVCTVCMQSGDEGVVTQPCLLYPLDSEMDSSVGSESSDVRLEDKEEVLGGLFLPESR